MYSAGTNGHIPSAWLPPQILYLLPRSADSATYTGNTDTEEIRRDTKAAVRYSVHLWGAIGKMVASIM